MANDDMKFHELRFRRLRSDIADQIGTQVFQEDNAWSSMASTLVSSVYGSNWDRSVFFDVYTRAVEIFSNCSLLNTNDVLDLFLDSFRTLCQLFPSIESLRCQGLPILTKVRTISLPLYVSLLEGCYSNLSRCVLGLLAEEMGKDYTSQNTLRPMSDILIKNGFSSLGDIPDVNLRNAINHGDVSLKAIGGSGCTILYTFAEKHESYSKILSSYDLDHRILTTLGKLYGGMLGMLVVFEANGIESLFASIDNSYIRDMYYGLQKGGKSYRCIDVQEVADSAQISYTFETSETSRSVLFVAAESIISNLYNAMPSFGQYYISFANPRLPINFLRAQNSDVKTFIDGGSKTGELIMKIIKSREVLWMGASDENINLYEAEYYRFPFIENEEMRLHDVEDASLSDRKRLKARLFIGQTVNRAEIVRLIETAVEWVASLHNPPSATIRIKHGDMKADCVYMNVYRNELDEDKSLFEKNDNFVCQVEYCPNVEFRLPDTNQLINYLYRNSQWINKSVRLLWRERKYLTIENHGKVGRNDPCPCGSGKKYKKCCGR